MRTLSRFRLQAADGALGHPKNWLFDDAQWTVRFLVLDAGFWLARRTVCVAPSAFGPIDERAWVLFLEGTRKHLEHGAPSARDAHTPRSQEGEPSRRLAWFWADAAGPVSPAAIETAHHAVGALANHLPDPHLRHWREALACRLQAGDTDIGQVCDFIAEDQDWTILFLVVDAGHGWAGKKLLVLPDWIESANWQDGVVRVNVPRQLICDAPQFVPSRLSQRQYVEELFDLYYVQGL